jgi:hypothetical protein
LYRYAAGAPGPGAFEDPLSESESDDDDNGEGEDEAGEDDAAAPAAAAANATGRQLGEASSSGAAAKKKKKVKGAGGGKKGKGKGKGGTKKKGGGKGGGGAKGKKLGVEDSADEGAPPQDDPQQLLLQQQLLSRTSQKFLTWEGAAFDGITTRQDKKAARKAAKVARSTPGYVDRLAAAVREQRGEAAAARPRVYYPGTYVTGPTAVGGGRCALTPPHPHLKGRLVPRLVSNPCTYMKRKPGFKICVSKMQLVPLHRGEQHRPRARVGRRRGRGRGRGRRGR